MKIYLKKTTTTHICKARYWRSQQTDTSKIQSACFKIIHGVRLPNRVIKSILTTHQGSLGSEGRGKLLKDDPENPQRGVAKVVFTGECCNHPGYRASLPWEDFLSRLIHLLLHGPVSEGLMKVGQDMHNTSLPSLRRNPTQPCLYGEDIGTQCRQDANFPWSPVTASGEDLCRIKWLLYISCLDHNWPDSSNFKRVLCPQTAQAFLPSSQNLCISPARGTCACLYPHGFCSSG